MKVEGGATLEVLLAGPAALDAATLLLEDGEVRCQSALDCWRCCVVFPCWPLPVSLLDFEL